MKYLTLITVALFLVGCGGSGGSSQESTHFDPIQANYSLTEANSIITIKNSKDATLHIDLGPSPKSLYVVTTSHFDNQKVTVRSSLATSVTKHNSQESTQLNLKRVNNSLANRILRFNEETFKLLRIKDHSQEQQDPLQSKEARVVSQGAAESFCVDMDSSYSCKRRINATAVRVKRSIPTTQGDKNLVIWLEDGVLVKSSALNHLSDIFLKQGLDNDIYDWETNIFSKEWGEDAESIDRHLIGDDATINILVYNMQSNAMAGFFWPKDNFKKSYIAASNEKIMFYINANLLNSDEKETFTTLDHEFQHMIHFYQRAVLKDLHDDTWFNELMSEATEDLLATKIGYKGPRNVDPNNGSAGANNNKKGRYPIFNAHNTLPLTEWGGSVAHYGKASAFGAYLNRNYDGAKLLHDMMISSKPASQVLKEVTGVDTQTLVNQWGVAVVLSDQTNTDEKFKYNRGDFFSSSYGESSYQLGSINFFNYTPTPRFKESATLDNNANLYSKIGENLTGKIDVTITANKGVTISLIAK